MSDRDLKTLKNITQRIKVMNSKIKLIALLEKAHEEFNHNQHEESEKTCMKILETNPDIIFIGGTYSSQLKKDLFLDEKWKDINAVKNNNVHIVPVGCCYWNDCTVEYPMIIYYVYSCMYPEQTDFSIKDIAHDFYLEYYEIDFNDEDMEKMMNGLAPNGEAICDQLRK
jgi:hypothetical protein